MDNLKPVMEQHMVVTGRVQGVGFRYFTYESARERAITGWVRNLRDGRVEILAQGSEEVLERFLADVKKGPSGSRVDSVECSRSTPSIGFSSFEIKLF